MRQLSARWLILVGVYLTALGMVFSFQLERHSLHASIDREFFFLEYAFLPVLLLGLLATLVGSVMWAWRRASVSSLAASGRFITVLTLLASKAIPINVHGWTGSFIFVFLVSLLIGVLFVVFAAVRFTSSRLALRRR